MEHFTSTTEIPSPPAETAAPVGHVLEGRWPSLGRALGNYQRNVADRFSMAAYDSVEAGIIRLEERRRLTREAEELGIRPFDAQLLIACALRQWVIDHGYDPTPSRDAPALSFEYKAWTRAWVRVAMIACGFMTLEAFIVWKWLINP